MRVLSLPLLGSLAATAQAIAFPGPQPTNGHKEAGLGWNPKPTVGPILEHGQDLRIRAIDALPQTCGWIDGDLMNPLTCIVTSATCAFYLPEGHQGMVGCCTAGFGTCGWANSCIDAAAISRSSCGADCWANQFILKCTAATRPYCLSRTWGAAAAADYGCGTDPASTWTTIQMDVSGFVASPPTAPQSAVTGWLTTPSPISTTPRPGPSSPIPPPDNGGPSIGLIAGASVGGVAVLAAIAGALIFFCVRNKKKQRQQQQQHVSPTFTPNAGPPPPMMQQQQHQPMYSPPPGHQPQGYFPPGFNAMSTNGADNKYNPAVAAYPASPISSPGSPAPPYDRKSTISPLQTGYGQPTLGVPQQGYVAPHDGAVEIESAPAPAPAPYQPYTPPVQEDATEQPTTEQAQQQRQRQQGPVYEIGP